MDPQSLLEQARPPLPQNDRPQHRSSSFITLLATSRTDGSQLLPQITLSGLSLVIANLATLLVLDPSYTGKELPSWAYFSSVAQHLSTSLGVARLTFTTTITSRFGIGLFAYQSLDAIDGCVGPSHARLMTRVLEPFR